jgi:hypothetical protein
VGVADAMAAENDDQGERPWFSRLAGEGADELTAIRSGETVLKTETTI